ncbi:MAG: LptF/LptG family permease [Silvanigrellales bacterium]|nr:LptF/LptG family permease [Silvanigrellales bacterium]
MIFARYLAREFLKINGFIIVFFLGMYCIIDFLEKNTRYFPKYDAQGVVILEFYLTQLPKMFVDLLPFSTMFSALITLFLFAKNGEISAMRAAGMSVFRVCRPLVVIGGVLSVVSFLMNEFVVPLSTLHLKKVETVKIEKSELGRMFFESNWVRGEGSILHFKSLNQLERGLEGVEYFVFKNPAEVKLFVHARAAVFDTEKSAWTLRDARVTTFTDQGRLERVDFQAFYPTNVVSQPPRLLREGVTADQISYRELRELIEQSKRAGGAIASREVELYQKLSLPLANFLFVFFALPFALRKERQADTYIGVIYCLAAAILFWVGNLSMRNLGQNGVVPPLIAAWAVTGILGLFCFLLVRKLDRAM